ncbi:MAG: hypothetical protein ABL309_01690 [Phycisphaerales bacterium]
MPRRKKRQTIAANKFRDEMDEAVRKHGALVPTGIAAALIGISRQALHEIMTRHRYAYVVVRTPDHRTHNLIPLATCSEIINERESRQQYISGSGFRSADKPPKGGSVEVSQTPASYATRRRRRHSAT